MLDVELDYNVAFYREIQNLRTILFPNINVGYSPYIYPLKQVVFHGGMLDIEMDYRIALYREGAEHYSFSLL